MKTKKFLALFYFFLAFLILVSSSSTYAGSVYAIVNCKIVPVASPAIDKGVIIIRDGLILSLGPSEKIVIPEDAEVIEAEGLIAYPGLIDAHTNLFLELPKEEPAQRQRGMAPQEKETGRYSDLMIFKLLKPKKTTIGSYHKIGVTTVLVAPKKGIFAGQSVLLNLNGEKAETMVVKNPVALHINFTRARGIYPATVMGAMALLKQSFLDTGHYHSHKSLYVNSSKGIKRPEYDPFLEALVPFTLERKPIIFTCNNQEDIKRALRLIDEFKLNGFLSGANEAWRVADYLKKTPLFVSLHFKPPITSIYVNKGEELKEKAEKEIYPANASNLHKSGIRFALTSYGLTKASDYLKNIQKAIKAGLPKEEALKAVTIHPAQFLGVNNIMGSLSTGKIANVILTSGEIFEEKTRVERVFVDGVMFKIKKPPEKVKAPALNLAGKWQGTVTSPMGELDVTVELEQEENEISGTITSNFGKWEISDGILSGNDLTFTISATIMGESIDMEFSGKAEQDLIEGTFSFSSGSAEIRVTRVPTGVSQGGNR
jgi:imidazolonepropionase-like amidohydrolase